MILYEHFEIHDRDVINLKLQKCTDLATDKLYQKFIVLFVLFFYYYFFFCRVKILFNNRQNEYHELTI